MNITISLRRLITAIAGVILIDTAISCIVRRSVSEYIKQTKRAA